MGPIASPQREDRGWRKARVGSTRTHSPMQEGGPGLRMVPPGSLTSLLGQFWPSLSPSRSRVKLSHWRCSWRIQAQNSGRLGAGERDLSHPLAPPAITTERYGKIHVLSLTRGERRQESDMKSGNLRLTRNKRTIHAWVWLSMAFSSFPFTTYLRSQAQGGYGLS